MTMTTPSLQASPHAFRRFGTVLRSRIGIGCVLTLIILIISVTGPLIAPYSPASFVGKPFALPSADHLLGTDFRGRDVLSRLLYGGWPVVWMSVTAASIGMILGVGVGMLAAYSRGWLDDLLMRLMDVFLSIPQILFVLLVVSLLGAQNWLVVLLIGIAHMPQVARITRSVTADVVAREYIQYCEILSVPRWRIIFREILPNIATPLLVEFGIRIVWSIAGIAALSMMGYGIQPPAADWGLMINENRARIATRPLPVLVPGLMVGLFALSVNMIAEGIAGRVSGTSRKTGQK